MPSLLNCNTCTDSIGPSKHFIMLIAYNRFAKSLPSNIKPPSIEQLWSKLESFYDLDLLEVRMRFDFKRLDKRVEFALPDGWIKKRS